MGMAIALLSAWGCGHHGPVSETPPAHAPIETEPTAAAQSDAPFIPAEDVNQVGTPRTLGTDATFQDLIALASRLDDGAFETVETSCLLSGEGPYRLEADVAVSVRPLPSAPADLDARATKATQAQALLRWGPLGQDGLTVVSFAHPRPPKGRAALLVITDEGLYVLGLGHSRAPTTTQAPVNHLNEVTALLRDVQSLWVTAESGIALSRLRAVLGGLPTHLHGHIGLAVALAEGTKLPTPLPAQDDGAGLCPQGLTPLADDAPIGDLAIASIRETLGELLVRGERCLAQARGPAALGGVIEQWLRVGPRGEVTETCWSSDPLGDPALRSCLLSASKALRFSPPAPSGSVDLQLPVRLEPTWPAASAPVCDRQ